RRRPSRSLRRVRSAISSATYRQSCVRQLARRSYASWRSSLRLKAYVGTEPVSSRWLSNVESLVSCSGNAREHEHWNLSRSLLPVLIKDRHLLGLIIEQPLPFLTSCHCHSDAKA